MEQAERIRFLGIGFRNDGHLGWFLMSMTAFTIVLTILTAEYYLGYTLERGWYVIGLAFGHVALSLRSANVTKWGEIVTPGYSKDCIWFNALMAALYAAVWIVIGRPL